MSIHTRADFTTSKLSLAEVSVTKTLNYLILFTILCSWLCCLLSLRKKRPRMRNRSMSAFFSWHYKLMRLSMSSLGKGLCINAVDSDSGTYMSVSQNGSCSPVDEWGWSVVKDNTSETMGARWFSLCSWGENTKGLCDVLNHTSSGTLFSSVFLPVLPWGWPMTAAWDLPLCLDKGKKIPFDDKSSDLLFCTGSAAHDVLLCS